MKKWISIFGLLLITMICSAEQLDKIVAKVGRDIILQSEVEKRMKQIETAGYNLENITRTDILNDMIESKLIVHKAKSMNINVSKEESRELARKEINKMKTKFPSEEVFRQELRKEMGMSETELLNYYIEMLNEQKIREQLINQEIKKKIHVTEVEINDYFQENLDTLPKRPELIKVGMIMRSIKPGKETRDIALKKINSVKEKALTGADFSDLAIQFSDCPSGKNGGDLGFFGKGVMVSAFEVAAFKLNPGEMSDVVETNFGYHLIKLIEKNKEADEIRVQHILVQIQLTEQDNQVNLDLMNSLLIQLRNGADFSELAKTYSEDNTTSLNGGIIGEFPQDGMPEMFQSQLVKINVGEFTEVIRESDIFYILAKTELIPERTYSYDEVYDNIRQLIMQQKEHDIYETWIKQMIKESFVEVYLDE
jgi:peptidyl-prolyl cis-trans isomerase SurA